MWGGGRSCSIPHRPTTSRSRSNSASPAGVGRARCVYRSVNANVLGPNYACTVRIDAPGCSTPPACTSEANLCRSRCGLTTFITPRRLRFPRDGLAWVDLRTSRAPRSPSAASTAVTMRS